LIPSSAPRTPEEELKSFQIAPGFRIELVAGDPLVQDPVAMQIGPDGGMWVVEMRGFMADLDGVKEAEPVGDVVVLEDTDGDGIMDKRTVFQDGLVMPRALIGAPPHLWFCRDTNGDGRADEKKEIANNFGMQSDPVRPEVANPEQAPNSLLWANDNWIHAAHWTRKFRYNGGQWTGDVATFRGQWGLSQDNEGHFLYNSNQDPLRADILPSHYTGRNPNHVPCDGVNVQVYTDQFVWPIRVNPGLNRGYRDGILRGNYRLKEFTAACAPCIYRGGLFPAGFDGNAFICEPAGNLIKREIITGKNGTLTCKEAYDQREFLASTDERFRPVNLYTGPDGALYVTDLYRGVLQHRESFTTYLRKYSEERGLDKPLHLGRIWRIVPDGKAPPSKPMLHQQTPAQWVEHLSHANSWWRETAQRLLVERNDASVVPALQALALKGDSSLGRVHALWTLDGMNRIEADTALAALKDGDARVRAAAVRVSEGLLKTADRAKVLPKLIAMTNEDAPFVQQQLVLTLSEAVDKEADHAIATLVKQAVGTAFIQDAALSGLAGRELALLDHLLADKGSPPPDSFLSALARCIFGSRNGAQVEQLLGLVVAHPEHAKPLGAGIWETRELTRKKPVKFKSEPAALNRINNSNVATLLTWPGKPGAKPEPPIIPLTSAQQSRYELGKVLFTGVCAACHQPHGLGLGGVAPPLVDSEWVLGSEQRLARIVLHGLTGPLSVKGRTYRLDMPALGVFNDEQIAGILTYIRRGWEHNAAPVEPDTIKAIRSDTSARHEAWLQEDLQKIP
jgi:mono/diheme cytochrome c family protein